MSAVAGRLVEPRTLATAGVVALACAIGALAGVDPKLAIAASLGLAFILVAVVDLAVGVAVFGILTFLELAPATGGPALSFAKLAGLTLAISWLATVATNPSRDRLLFTQHPWLTAAIVAFVGWTVISCLWAEDVTASIDTITRYVLNAAVFPIAYAALRQPKHLRWVGMAIAGGAGLAAAYGLVAIPSASAATTSVTAAGELDRIAGTVGDPNLLASVLVVGLVMSLALAFDPRGTLAFRSLAIGNALICFAAVVATVSRGGIVALAAALIAAVLVAGKRRPQAAVTVLGLAAIAAALFAMFATEAQTARLTQADGGSGRTDIWKVGWRMVEAEPLTGQGIGNFNVSSIHYLLVEPGALERDEFIVDVPSVAHNMYLEILSEVGIPGLVLFLVLPLAGIVLATRAARRFERLDEPGLAMLACAVAVGIVSMLAADFFLSAQFSKLLWLLMALGPAMFGLAVRMQRDAAAGGPAAS